MQASISCRFGLLLVVTAAVRTSSAMALDGLPASPGAESAFVLKADAFKHYVDRFNAMEDENVVNLIPNSQSWDWMKRNIPLLECPDKDLEEIYYYRWWTYRKHIKQMPDYMAITEFLTYKNPVSSAVGHHICEGRWIHDKRYLDEDLLYWLRGADGKPHDNQHYSSWTVWSAYQRYLVNLDKAFLIGMLDDFVRDYQGWENARRAPDGTYWQFEAQDAMEDSINGARKKQGCRPSISSYMYGNALAIAEAAAMAGKSDLAATYRAKAAQIKKAVQARLWDEQAHFFKVRWLEDGAFSDAREAIGFIPWYFELPDRGYEDAWRQLIDPAGFWAPLGITTAERRHPRFRTHGSGHGCEWDGPVWPFATSQTLVALVNVLNDYPQTYVTKEHYFEALKTYVKSQHRNGKPYIGEYLDEKNGDWLKGDNERSRYYNHSTFCDLIITGLAGLRPRADAVLDVNPLLPADDWDWFCLDNILYHGQIITVLWDRTGQKYGKGPGLSILADGRQIAHAEKLEQIVGELKSLPSAERHPPKEDSYTITAVIQVLNPVNPADMNDDFQDARVLAQDKDSCTVEVTYYPLYRPAIGENPNWRKDDAGMTEYLQPTTTENWDETMQRDLIAELHQAGIEPDRLTDKQLVEQVSGWAMKRAHSTQAFGIWAVSYPDGKPTVYPPLRDAFDRQKPDKTWTDQQIFDQEVLGRSMFYNKVHGSCTSCSIYLATILRALGIPTRIVFCIPPFDPNDDAQSRMFYDNVHHNQARETVRAALDGMNGFDNHLFNEVYVGRRWVRLNYTTLGQPILDARYFGLLTHIYTCSDLSQIPLAQTWGMRYFNHPADDQPKLSSINPYRLISVDDHFGANAQIDNPPVPLAELRTVTIIGFYFKESPEVPKWVAEDTWQKTKMDFLIASREWIPSVTYQMRTFEKRAGHEFLLDASGHPTVKAHLNGLRLSSGDGSFHLAAVT
ncbi:MAG: transglutaminase domain-containing protein [Thermoguttaceae bacterium]